MINISSLLGRVPFATIRSAYSGAKHLLNALTALFRAEVQETHPGIQFSLISPGVVRTEFGHQRDARGARTPARCRTRRARRKSPRVQFRRSCSAQAESG